MRTYGSFVYSIDTTTRLAHDYQIWQTYFGGNLQRCAKVYTVWAFFSGLCFLYADWLSGQTPITWKQTNTRKYYTKEMIGNRKVSTEKDLSLKSGLMKFDINLLLS